MVAVSSICAQIIEDSRTSPGDPQFKTVLIIDIPG